jgi:predicted dehydrogenase
MQRQYRFGMLGGGKGSFIGSVHRMAAQLDGKATLVCGAFSSNPRRSIESAATLMLPKERVYRTYRDLFRTEAKLPAEERMDFVVIATPNNMHYPMAMAAIDAGYHVICEKPMTLSLEEAVNLAQKTSHTNRLFMVMYGYIGFPMVREARDLVVKGKLGKVRRVVVEFPQGWLATRLETAGNRQANWRADPKQAGATCCMGDIGTHCQHLAEYVTGLRITELSADVSSFVKGRQLDDDGSVLLHFDTGAKGVLWASQIAIGEDNGLSLRVYCEQGSLHWRQEEPNTLRVDRLDKPPALHRSGSSHTSLAATATARLPAGHPEGFIEAFANLYRDFYSALDKVLAGGKVDADAHGYPTAMDGVHGMAFIDAVVKSAKTNNAWTPLADALGPIRFQTQAPAPPEAIPEATQQGEAQ